MKECIDTYNERNHIEIESFEFKLQCLFYKQLEYSLYGSSYRNFISENIPKEYDFLIYNHLVSLIVSRNDPDYFDKLIKKFQQDFKKECKIQKKEEITNTIYTNTIHRNTTISADAILSGNIAIGKCVNTTGNNSIAIGYYSLNSYIKIVHPKFYLFNMEKNISISPNSIFCYCYYIDYHIDKDQLEIYKKYERQKNVKGYFKKYGKDKVILFSDNTENLIHHFLDSKIDGCSLLSVTLLSHTNFDKKKQFIKENFCINLCSNIIDNLKIKPTEKDKLVLDFVINKEILNTTKNKITLVTNLCEVGDICKFILNLIISIEREKMTIF